MSKAVLAFVLDITIVAGMLLFLVDDWKDAIVLVAGLGMMEVVQRLESND